MPISAVLYQLYNGFKHKKLLMKRQLSLNEGGGGGKVVRNRGTYRDDTPEEMRRNRDSVLSLLEMHEDGSDDEDEMHAVN